MGHGTRTSYTDGCRCDECRAANAAYQRERYQARADVRDQKLALMEQRRREAGVGPRQPAQPPEVLAERARVRDRESRAVETAEQREARSAARREATASQTDEQRAHRLELQRARNAAYRARLAQQGGQQ